MATKEIIKDTLQFLANIWPKKINDDLIEGYYNALRGYSNEQIVEAAAKYSEEDNDYFPTPGKLKKCITIKNYDGMSDSTFHLTEYKMRCQSPGCHKKDLCIREPNEQGVLYICRDCYSGMTFEQRREKFTKIKEGLKIKEITEQALHRKVSK